MHGEPKAVFLSYASEDSEAAQRLAAALIAAGIEVWFDKAELRGGDAWDQTIRQRIRDCQLFIPIISANSDARAEGYFRREWKLAVERTHDMSQRVAFLVPIVFDLTSEAAADVPDIFRSVQWTRLPEGVASASFIDRVIALLGDKRAAMSPATPLTALPTIQQETRSKHSAWITAGLSALLVVVGGASVVQHHFATRDPTATGTSIAVLPFVDLSEKHDQQYLADGIAEEVLTLLTKIPGLKVVSRTSSFQFRGTAADLRTIGAKLGASFLVEASVRRFGDQIRIDAQLVASNNDTPVWSESYDSALNNVLGTQRDIATAIARELRLEVGSAGWPMTRAPANVAAYGLYLRGLHALNRYDRSGLEDAVGYFSQALELDSSLIRARERLAQAHYLQMELGSVPARVAAERLRTDTNTVLSQDSRSVLGHALRAELLLTQDWDWAGAAREAQLAATLGRTDSFALYAAADVAGVAGRWDESETLFRRSLDVDPLDADTHGLLGWTLYHAGRYKDAEAEDRRALAISPSRVLDHYNLGLALLAEGRAKEAQAAFEEEPLAGPQRAGLAMAFNAMGMEGASTAALRTAESENGDEWAYFIACAHALRNEPDAAFAWLDRAYAQRDYNFEYLKGEWALKGITEDPRYTALLHKMNFQN